MDLFKRFKDKDIDKLLELSVRFKANRNYEKAELTDLLIKVKSQDIEGLKNLKKEFEGTDEWMGFDFTVSLLEEKLKSEEKKAKKSENTSPESSFSLSKEVYRAMSKKIKQDAKRHRDHIETLRYNDLNKKNNQAL